MIAIIPCAGRGTRRKPDTNYMPKILLDYQGDPLIEHIARPIDASGLFTKIVFVLSPRTGLQIVDYLRRNPLETPVRYVWQNEPLGFGHAVLQAKEEVFSWRRRNPFVFVATDDGVRNPSNPDKPSFELIRKMAGRDTSTLGVKWIGNIRLHGMVITGEGGKARRGGSKRMPSHLPRANSPCNVQVERLVEKPYWDEGGLALTGLYFIRESRRLFRCLDKLVKSGRCLGGEYQFTHALQMMLDQHAVFQTHYHDWIDCGSEK